MFLLPAIVIFNTFNFRALLNQNVNQAIAAIRRILDMMSRSEPYLSNVLPIE